MIPRNRLSDHLKSGWLKRQCLEIEEDALKWPDWMLEEGGRQDIIEKKKRFLKSRQKRVVKSIDDFLKIYLPDHYGLITQEKSYKELLSKIKKEIQ